MVHIYLNRMVSGYTKDLCNKIKISQSGFMSTNQDSVEA